MKFIESLIRITKNRTLILINTLIKKNKYMNCYEISNYDKRNPETVKKDLARLVKLGIVLCNEKPSFVGKTKYKRYYPCYKSNNSHSIIKKLNKII